MLFPHTPPPRHRHPRNSKSSNLTSLFHVHFHSIYIHGYCRCLPKPWRTNRTGTGCRMRSCATVILRIIWIVSFYSHAPLGHIWRQFATFQAQLGHPIRAKYLAKLLTSMSSDTESCENPSFQTPAVVSPMSIEASVQTYLQK
jgi:hypothetical protein